MKEIPTVLRSQELLDMAFRKASKITIIDKKPFFRIQKTESRKLQTISDILDSKILRTVRSFPSFEHLDPFTAEMMDIAFSRDRIRISLGRINGIRRAIRKICGVAQKRIRKATEPGMIIGIRKSAYGRISSIVLEVAEPFEFLSRVRESLRKMPRVDPDMFTVVVAGFPNVGKSALVAALSTAKPQIAQYPFTTHDVILGHVERSEGHTVTKIQLIDTPGVLERPPEEHNEFEKRAMSAIRNLAHLILYVADASEYCGYPVSRQEELLASVRKNFGEKPFIYAISKSDVEPERGNTFAARREEDWIAVSAMEREGLDGLLDALFERYSDHQEHEIAAGTGCREMEETGETDKSSGAGTTG